MKKAIFIFSVIIISTAFVTCSKDKDDDKKKDLPTSKFIGTLIFDDGTKIKINSSKLNFAGGAFKDEDGYNIMLFSDNIINGYNYNFIFSIYADVDEDKDVPGIYIPDDFFDHDKIFNLNLNVLKESDDVMEEADIYSIDDDEIDDEQIFKIDAFSKSGMKGKYSGKLIDFSTDISVDVDIKFELTGNNFSYYIE